MNLEEINSIIYNKWKELEGENDDENSQEEIEKIIEHNIEKLKEIILQLDSLKDFEKEYNHFLENPNPRQEVGELAVEMDETEQADEDFRSFVLEKIIQKWCFLFCGIINLDIANNMNIFYARKAIEEILENE